MIFLVEMWWKPLHKSILKLHTNECEFITVAVHSFAVFGLKVFV